MSALTESFRLQDIQAAAILQCGSVETPATVTIKNGTYRKGTTLDEVAVSLIRALKRPAVVSRAANEAEQEEQLSAITHGLGFVVSAAAAAYLLTFVSTLGGSLRLASCGVYGISLVMMYAASTALHAARRPDLKRRFQLCDHISIYVLIAGTYTPFLAVLLQGYLGFSMLACVWAIAAFGIAIKLKYADRLAETSPLPCLGLGWLVLAVIKPLMAVLPAGGMALLVAGGVSYSIGMIFYCRDDKRYFHAIWHLFVIAGTSFHPALFITMRFCTCGCCEVSEAAEEGFRGVAFRQFPLTPV